MVVLAGGQRLDARGDPEEFGMSDVEDVGYEEDRAALVEDAFTVSVRSHLSAGLIDADFPLQFHDVDMDKFSAPADDEGSAAGGGAGEAAGADGAAGDAGNPVQVARALMQAHDESTTGNIISEHSYRRQGGVEF